MSPALSRGALLGVLLAAAAALAADPSVVRGVYAEQKGGRAWFVPCGSGKKLELMDSNAARELRTLFATLGARSVRSMFVEVTGRRDGDAFSVGTVLRAQTGGLGCSEDLRHVVAKAGGQDPSWSMVFDDTRLAFQRVGDRAPAAFPPVGLQKRGDRFEFTGETEAARIHLVLVKERCEDALANAILPYRAEITFSWRAEGQSNTYRGCAYLGDAAG
jgi:uncharacterized membrane protein